MPILTRSIESHWLNLEHSINNKELAGQIASIARDLTQPNPCLRGRGVAGEKNTFAALEKHISVLDRLARRAAIEHR